MQVLENYQKILFFALSVETESVETESEFEVETDENTVCSKTSATKNRKCSHQMKKKPKKSTVKEQSSDFLRDIPFDSNRTVTVEVKCSHDDINLKTDNDEAKCLHNEMSLKSDKAQMNILLTEKETSKRKRSHQMKKKPKKSTVKEQSSDFLRDIPFDSNRTVTVEVKCSHDDINLKTDNDEAKCLHNEMSLKSDKEQMSIPLTEKETSKRKQSHLVKKKTKKSTVKEQSSDFLRDIPFDSNRTVTVEVKCSHDDINLKTDNDEAKCLHNEMSLKSDKDQMNIPLTENDTSMSSQNMHQLFIDISCLGESGCQNCLVLNIDKESVSAQYVIDYIVCKTGVSESSIFLKTLSGTYINKNDSINSTETCNLKVFIKIVGGMRKRKGSQIHPDKECGPCCLCNKTSFRYYFHLISRQDNHDLLNYFKEQKPDIEDTDCICNTCEETFKRSLKQKSCKITKDLTVCYINSFKEPNVRACNNSDCRTIVVNEAEIVQIFSLPVELASFNNISVTLCSAHRLKYFNDKRLRCDICNLRFRKGMYKKKIPTIMTEFVEEYLKCVPGSSSRTDDLKCSNVTCCTGCYYTIEKFMHDNFSASCETDLTSTFDSILNKWNEAECRSQSPGLAESVVYCCHYFLDHKPVLLSSVFKVFDKCANETEKQDASHRSLLQTLLSIFGSAIQVLTDSNKRLGTMIKRTDENDNKVLHKMTYEESFREEAISSQENTLNVQSKTNSNSIKEIQQMIEALKSKVLKHQFDLQSFDPFKFIKEFCDVSLWNFIYALFGEKPIESENKICLENYKSTKVLPCLGIISNILYASDHSCNMPLPTLFADILDKYTSSSSECLKIFNQFGICCSKDSLQRYQTSVVEKDIESGVHLSPESFTICSIDNINKRSSYAAVKSRDTSRGFDGTSVQLVEQKPHSIKWHESEKSEFLKDCVCLQDNRKITYKQINVLPDLSLYRCLSNGLFIDLRHGERASDGYLQCDEDMLKENNFSKVLQEKSNKLIVKYYKSLNEEYSIDNVPQTITFLACAYITKCVLNIYKKDKEDNIYLWFSSNELPDGLNSDTACIINILQIDLNDENVYMPIYSFESFYQGSSVSDMGMSYSELFFNEEFISLFKAFAQKQLSFGGKPSKQKRRSLGNSVNIVDQYANIILQNSPSSVTFDDASIPCYTEIFSATAEETAVSSFVDNNALNFGILKYTAQHTNLNTFSPSFPEFLEFQNLSPSEKSNVIFFCVHGENADNKDTIKMTLNKLHIELGIGKRINYLVVVGDGKTYDYLIKLKKEFGNELKWVLPYIGDWHVLKNYLSILMKIYADAGLKDLVDLFHQGILSKVLLQVISFDKTHHFFLQIWEALFRLELQFFFNSLDQTQLDECGFSFEKASLLVTEYMKSVKKKTMNIDEVKTQTEKLFSLTNTISDKFYSFFREIGEVNKTWKIWHNFIHVDCMIYIKYYLSLRIGDWNLRNFCVKHISRLAQTTDSRFYCRLLPQNLVDISRFPKFVIDHFKQGGFVMNVLGRSNHCQGLDEGHESCINKDVKAALNTCSNMILSKVVSYVPFRAKCLKNLKNKLGSSCSDLPYFSESTARTNEENVLAYMQFLLSKAYLSLVLTEPVFIG